MNDLANYPWEATLAPNTLLDPYQPGEAILRDCPPLFRADMKHSRLAGGIWVATRFEPIREIFNNSDRYSSSAIYPYFRAMGIDLTAIPIQLDPPVHTKFRKFLEPCFSPKAVVALAPVIPALEIGAALAWFLSLWRDRMVVIAGLTLSVFTLAYALHLVFGEAPKCGCLGLIEAFKRFEDEAAFILGRNIVLLTLLLVGRAMMRPRFDDMRTKPAPREDAVANPVGSLQP